MVNNFTNKNGKSQRDFLTERHEIAPLGIRIDVTNNTLVAGVDKGGNLGFEILDVLVGALNLRPTSVE